MTATRIKKRPMVVIGAGGHFKLAEGWLSRFDKLGKCGRPAASMAGNVGPLRPRWQPRKGHSM